MVRVVSATVLAIVFVTDRVSEFKGLQYCHDSFHTGSVRFPWKGASITERSGDYGTERINVLI